MSSQTVYPQNDERCAQCKRPFRQHCPICGSMQCYALMSKKDVVTRPDGLILELTVYRCKRCAHIYNDDDWQFRCHAPQAMNGRPPVSGSRTQIRPTHAAGVAPVEPDAVMKAVLAYKKKVNWDGDQ